MASSRAVNIACTIASSVALRRVVNAIELEGARGLALTRAAVLDATKTGAIDGLIYDLEPGDATSTIFVKMVHDARPDWPLLLYHAPRLALIERVVESALSKRWMWISGGRSRRRAPPTPLMRAWCGRRRRRSR
jgi:hypothetical protein